MYKMNRKEREENLQKVIQEYVNDRKQSMTEKETKFTQNRFTDLELETRFGTIPGTRIQRNDYTHIVEKLKSLNWKIKSDFYDLRITPEYVDVNTGRTKQSNIRAEIRGIEAIREYCKTNELNVENSIFTQKRPVRDEDQNYTIDYLDFGFRVQLSTERRISKNSNIVQKILQTWNDSKKIFRLIQRITFQKPNSRFQIDLSIVRSSIRKGRFMVPEYTITESGVMKNPEQIELECEAMDDRVRTDKIFNETFSNELHEDLRNTITQILGAIQQSNYPISIDEQRRVLLEYMGLMMKHPKLPKTRDFCGPSSISLEQKNIVPLEQDNETPNIRMPYTVTDKADGKRKLLYIDGNGKIYLIDTNMNVQFTGSKTEEGKLMKSLLDGEHVLHNKKGQFINLYASFDIYFIREKDMRKYHFSLMPTDKSNARNRYSLLQTLIKNLNPKSINEKRTPIRIEHKLFYSSSGESSRPSIFKACQTILRKVDEGAYEYETDGLIFTPLNTGVGMNPDDDGKPSNTKQTWMRSFKWKPAEFNTVDFLFTLNKEGGTDVIRSIFENGKGDGSGIIQYKIGTLRVGFDERIHGYLNPCQRIVDDDLPKRQDTNEEYGNYKPVPFIPTNPYDPKASQCNVPLKHQGVDKVLITEEGEVIEDNTIIEFKYDIHKERGWRWIPLRVRYDKTAEFRRGNKNYGNAYHVAESVWRSIHQPVTEEMITTGRNIPPLITETKQTPIHEFNSYTRTVLYRIMGAGENLVDLNVGKAVDIPKWTRGKLNFVLGVDVNRDAIHNRIDGACARYLNYRKQYKIMPNALFIQANVEYPWEESFFTEKGKEIGQAVMGKGTKDRSLLGEGVYKQYGVAQEGFDMVSHSNVDIFFQSKDILTTFIQNVSKLCKVGGYFTGIMLDGEKVFELLYDKKQDEPIRKKGIWKITKHYDIGGDSGAEGVSSGFIADETTLGQEILVEHEQPYKTYLANMNYFIRIMEEYGFSLIPKEKAKKFNVYKPTSMVKGIHRLFSTEIKQEPGLKNQYKNILDMETKYKEFVYLQRYFIFQKRREMGVVVKEQSVRLEKSREDEEKERRDTKPKESKPKSKKRGKSLKELKKKIKMKRATPKE